MLFVWIFLLFNHKAIFSFPEGRRQRTFDKICRNNFDHKLLPAVLCACGIRCGTGKNTYRLRMCQKNVSVVRKNCFAAAVLLSLQNHPLRDFQAYIHPEHKNHMDTHFHQLLLHSGSCICRAAHSIPVHIQAGCRYSFRTGGCMADCHFADRCSIAGTGRSETFHIFPASENSPCCRAVRAADRDMQYTAATQSPDVCKIHKYGEFLLLFFSLQR